MMKANKTTVARYDFSPGDKLSTDQYKFLHKIFSQFADAVTSRLAPILQSRVQLELGEVRISSYAAYLHSLPDPTTMVLFKVDPETKALLALDFHLGFALLDKLMGGKGESVEGIRDFTEIEDTLFRKNILPKMLESYAASWKDLRDFKPQLEEVKLNPLAMVIVGPSENVVVASFKTRIANSMGGLDLCVPFRHIKAVVPQASFQKYLLDKTSQVSAGQPVAPLFAKNLEAARVPVSCELGRTEVLFQDLLHIEAGDILTLDTQIGEPLRVKVNERTKFLGRPGETKDKKVGIQITKVLTEGDEEFED